MHDFMKPQKRGQTQAEAEALIKRVQQTPCVACRRIPSDAHHVTTRGAGGRDSEDNLMPLCREHHAQWHQVGPSRMIEMYYGVFKWLGTHGREDVIQRAEERSSG